MMVRQAVGRDVDEWDVGGLDLGGYLQRIRHPPAAGCTGAVLAGLHRAHVAAIPFENLDIVLGRGISVELDDIQAKLVRRPRGGYCYEHALLFGAVLQRLGFGVERRLARIASHDPRPRARTHMVLEVHAADGNWLADVGFGSGPLGPLPLRPSGLHVQGDWTYAVRRSDDDTWRLEERQGGPPTVLYSFDDAVQHFADIRVANHFSSTVTTSPFVGRLVAVRKDEHTVTRLMDRELTRTGPARRSVHRELTDEDAVRALTEDFDLELDGDELAALVAALPTTRTTP